MLVARGRSGKAETVDGDRKVIEVKEVVVQDLFRVSGCQICGSREVGARRLW